MQRLCQSGAGSAARLSAEPAGWTPYFGFAPISAKVTGIPATGAVCSTARRRCRAGAVILHAADPQAAVFALAGPD